MAGKCDCGFKCLLCTGKHHARAHNCPVRGGFPPPTLATTGTTTTTPKSAAECKAEEKDVTETQRDDSFTKVGPKRLSHNQCVAKKCEQTLAKANAAILGSSSFTRIDNLNDPAPTPFNPVDIIFPNSDLLADADDTHRAFQEACGGPDCNLELNLRLANTGWGGSKEDSMFTHILSVPARYVVKHNLPLTTPHTKTWMASGLSQEDAATYLNTMENKWGGSFPLNYAMEQLPDNTRFTCDTDELPPPPPHL